MARLALCLLSASTAVAAAPTIRAADDAPEVAADYLPAIQQELARLDLQARCDRITATCVFQRRIAPAEEPFDIVVRYSRRTHTAYIYIDRLLALSDPEGPGLVLARRLLEINRSLVTGKLEWDRPTSSIRLSVVVNTDSNFDRKAFRSQLLGLWTSAERILPEMRTLCAGAPQTPATQPAVDGR